MMKYFYKILLINTILLTIGVLYSCKLIEPMENENSYFSIDTEGKLNCDKDTSDPANKNSCTAEPNDSPPGAGCGFNGTPPIKPTQDNNWIVCKGVD